MDEKDNLENLRCEYLQVNQNYRHFSKRRLAAVGFYFLVFLVITLFFFQILQATGNSDKQRTSSRLMGFFFTSMFLSFDIFCELNLRQLQKIAIRLEDALGLQQFKEISLPQRAWLHYIIWGMYGIFFFFCLVVGWEHA